MGGALEMEHAFFGGDSLGGFPILAAGWRSARGGHAIGTLAGRKHCLAAFFIGPGDHGRSGGCQGVNSLDFPPYVPIFPIHRFGIFLHIVYARWVSEPAAMVPCPTRSARLTRERGRCPPGGGPFQAVRQPRLLVSHPPVERQL